MRKSKKVAFERLSVTIDENGIEVSDWRQVAEAFASIEHRNGSQRWASGGYTAETTDLFRTNWSPAFSPTPAERLVWDGNTYDILSVSNINEGNREVEIRAKRTEKAQGRR